MNFLKHSILVLSLATIIFGGTETQGQSMAFGGKLGFSSSSLRNAGVSDFNRRNLAAAGAFFRYAPGKEIFSLQPEVLYAPKGGQWTNINQNLEVTYRINYLEIPLLAKLAIPIEGTFFPNIFLGPQIGFKLSEKISARNLNNDSQLNSLISTADAIDYGGVFGGGLDIKAKSLLLSLDIRYTLGANEIEQANELSDIKNGMFSMNIGVGFVIFSTKNE